MKNYNKLLLGLLSLIWIMGSCTKSPKGELEDEKPKLDANISFVTKPDPGKELFVNLWYTTEENELFHQRDADVVLRHTLTEQDIENGLTLTFEDFQESPYAYVTAYVDMDGDGELSHDDIAYAYFEQSLRSLIRGSAQANNVSHRQFMTIVMEELYSTVVSFEADFTFTIKPAEGTKLFLNLYYADQEELNFYQRTPDEVRDITLTEEHIENGVQISLNDMQDMPYIYAMAYLDINGNGELNHGDIAVSYNGKSMTDIISGQETASSIAGQEYVAIDMKDWLIQDDGVLRDIDGNVYETVVIGGKEWMTENLKVTRFKNGDAIVTGLSNTEWAATFNNGRVRAYAVYPYTESGGTVSSEAEMIAKYGLLYNGYAVEDTRGLCPAGWRVASDDDFKALEEAAGMPNDLLDATSWRGTPTLSPNVGLKLRSTEGWPLLVGTDDLGFKALPAGVRAETGVYGNFINAGNNGSLARAAFWTSTNGNESGTLGYRRLIESSRPHSVLRGTVAKREGYCVRCVRDR